ncbi:unnamed protein product [Staurois parvus]|uniref:Uncharacterized protein n=1 Tax=Staurois parvus TaxID=386267 RepID=A0ABN9AW31_9NEOB|nr:unnamed protein product [Staurois parvus]
MGEALEKSWRRAWEKETRELESRRVMRGAVRTVWVIFGDKIGDVIWGGVINGFICYC